MIRRASRPRSVWLDHDEAPADDRTIQVCEEDNEGVDTGLLDAHGDPLYRFPDRGPLGFMRSQS